MVFHSHANKTHFHKKGYALGLILKVRVLELGRGLIANNKSTSFPGFSPTTGRRDNLRTRLIANLKIADSFLKKWEFIVAIKSQCYLSTFCPTTKLHIPGIFLKTVLNN